MSFYRLPSRANDSNASLVMSEKSLDYLFEEARKSPRRRMNANIHPEGSPLNFFYNILMPDTYIQPHRHEGKEEYFHLVRGSVLIFTFDDEGNIEYDMLLAKNKGMAQRIPADTWHTIVVLEESVLLEVKLGPYDPATAKIFAPWAPEEGSEECPRYNRQLVNEFKKKYPRLLK